MPYNPQTDSVQLIGKPYKAAVKWLAKEQRNTDRNVVEKMIDLAVRARGKSINDFKSKE